MAHEIETVNGKVGFAYRLDSIKTPWHGLGNHILPGDSVEIIADKAGLDHTQEAWPIYMRNPTTGEFIKIGAESNKENSERMAIVRTSDNFVHQIATDGYNIVQNMDVVRFFKEYLDSAEMQIETAGSLRHGSVIWVLAKAGPTFTLPGNDFHETYIMLSTSHDGSQEFNGQFTNIATVCANTKRLAESLKRGRTFSIRHNAKMTTELMSDAKKQLGFAIEATEKYEQATMAMSQVSVSAQETYEYVASLVSPKLLEEMKVVVKDSDTSGDLLAQVAATTEAKRVLDSKDFNRAGAAILLDIAMGPGQELESRKDTVYGLYSGVTHYVDHVAGRDRDNALVSAWYGTGDKLKTKAYDLAMEYVARTK